MIFVFDIDDTIAETDKYSTEYIAQFFKDNNLPFKQVCNTARYAEQKFDWSADTAIEWYKTVGDQMMLHFPCKPHAVKLVNSLFDDGHTIIFATARDTNWHANPKQITLEWLQKNNIKYHKLYVGRVDKELICKEENADVFIDDDIEITAKVAEHNPNMQVFLSNTEYNNSLPQSSKVKRIYSLETLLDEFAHTQNN